MTDFTRINVAKMVICVTSAFANDKNKCWYFNGY